MNSNQLGIQEIKFSDFSFSPRLMQCSYARIDRDIKLHRLTSSFIKSKFKVYRYTFNYYSLLGYRFRVECWKSFGGVMKEFLCVIIVFVVIFAIVWYRVLLIS